MVIMKYRSEIDGLRAVAVIPVILYHAGFKSFSGGFIGVDIFFVISGYLITTIILNDMDSGKFSIVNFYERRARRILPVLFFVILCCLPFAWIWLMPNYYKEFSDSLSAVATFSSNILFWRESGYFATGADLKPLLHTWSLAVEEQYYVIFPLILMLLYKLRKRWIFGFLMIVAFVSLSLAQVGSVKWPSSTFFLLPARFWELTIGALTAFVFIYKPEQINKIRSKRILSEVMGFVGLLMIFFAMFTFDHNTPFPSVYALIPTLGTAFLIAFASPASLMGRILSLRPVVGVGLISYSAYLWHQPLFVFARHGSLEEPSVRLLLFLSGLSLLLAFISWKYIETPFRNKKVFSRKFIFSFAVVGSVLLFSWGAAGHINDGFVKRKTSSGEEYGVIADKIRVNHGLNKICDWKFTTDPECRTADNPEILVWGDSYAMHLVKGIISSKSDVRLIQMTKSQCGPFINFSPLNASYGLDMAKKCIEFNDDVLRWLRENKSVKYVVMSSILFQYVGDGNQTLSGDTVSGASYEKLREKLVETMDYLESIGVQPVFISPTPFNGNDIGHCLLRHEFLGGSLDECSFNYSDTSVSYQNVSNMLTEIGKTHRVVLLSDGICPNGKCESHVGSTYIYRDNGHLSVDGSAWLGKEMDFYGLISGNISAVQ